MTRQQQHLIALVASLDPLAARAAHAGLDERAREDLAHILRTAPDGPSPESRRAVPRRFALVAVPVLASLVMLSLLIAPQGGGGTAYAATPEPLRYQPAATTDARAFLAEMSARVGDLPVDTGSGRYAHMRTTSWSLFTRIDGTSVDSRVVPEKRETWTAPDGSGRVLAERGDEAGKVRDERVPAGGQALMWPLRSLSPDDRTLAEQLAAGHPVGNGPAERLVAFEDAFAQMPLPPQVRAAMLRYLAETDGLTVQGRVIDRAGRNGVAVSVDSDYSGLPTRYALVVDPLTGRLLASEDTLTTTAGALRVRVPSVVSYTTYVSAEYAADTSSGPR